MGGTGKWHKKIIISPTHALRPAHIHMLETLHIPAIFLQGILRAFVFCFFYAFISFELEDTPPVAFLTLPLISSSLASCHNITKISL